VRTLNQSGIKISAGSVSNVISEWRQSNTSTQGESRNRVITFRRESLAETEFKKKDISIENHVITNTQDFEENGYPLENKVGGPLSWFTNGNATINSATSMNNTGSSTLNGFELANSTSTGSNINNEVVYHNNEQNETSQTEKEFGGQHGIRASAASNQRPSVVDWDADHVKRLWYRIADETLTIGNRQKQLEQMQYDLSVREVRVKELEPYLSLARKLQEVNLTLEDASPWLETVKEVARTEKLDTATASLYVSQELALNRQLIGILGQIERANQELVSINMVYMQKKQILAILEDLMNRWVTESQIVQLVNFAGEWQKYWHQTSGLQQPGGNGNLQQSGSGYPGGNNNGYGDFSMNDRIRLNLLRSNTATMLNKMGV
jgi:hypothetical protein